VIEVKEDDSLKKIGLGSLLGMVAFKLFGFPNEFRFCNWKSNHSLRSRLLLVIGSMVFMSVASHVGLPWDRRLSVRINRMALLTTVMDRSMRSW